jgi:hypothetical protein
MKKIYLFIFLLFFSCQEKQQEFDCLEQALVTAGKNRSALGKVLQRYANNSEDSLKYQAAVFLIDNMPSHYSYKNEDWLNQFITADYLINNIEQAFDVWENGEKEIGIEFLFIE